MGYGRISQGTLVKKCFGCEKQTSIFVANRDKKIIVFPGWAFTSKSSISIRKIHAARQPGMATILPVEMIRDGRCRIKIDTAFIKDHSMVSARNGNKYQRRFCVMVNI